MKDILNATTIEEHRKYQIHQKHDEDGMSGYPMTKTNDVIQLGKFHSILRYN